MEKFQKLGKMIQENGGLLQSLKKLYRFDDLKTGKLVGTDAYGNKYFENNSYFLGSNRWVEYSDRVSLDYDGSQIPAEWHGWMHHNTDKPPTVSPPVQYKWISAHRENLTGTKYQYTPYDTVPPKIQSWTPGKK